eukprot:1425375-Amphidinium_carterae.1
MFDVFFESLCLRQSVPTPQNPTKTKVSPKTGVHSKGAKKPSCKRGFSLYNCNCVLQGKYSPKQKMHVTNFAAMVKLL